MTAIYPMPAIYQVESWDQTIPKNIYCKHDSLMGSLAESSLHWTYSEDDGGALNVPKRWNCNSRMHIEESKQVHPLPRTIAFREMTFTPKILVAFPEYFPPYEMGCSQVSQDNHDDDNHNSKRNFACKPNIFGSSRISTHSRMEMWQHQISKPFRSLSSRRPRTTDVNGLGKKILKSVVYKPKIAALVCSKPRKLVRITGEEEANTTFQQEQKAVATNQLQPVNTHDGEKGKQRSEFPLFPDRKECGSPNLIWSVPCTPKELSVQKGNIFQSDRSHWTSEVPTDESSADESSVDESAVILAVDLG
jgi:hypothetical protein